MIFLDDDKCWIDGNGGILISYYVRWIVCECACVSQVNFLWYWRAAGSQVSQCNLFFMMIFTWFTSYL